MGETKTLTIQCGLEMNARPENPDEDQRHDASGDDPGIASVQLRCGGLVILKAISANALAMKFAIVPAAETSRRASAAIASSQHSKCTDDSARGLPPSATQAPPCPTPSCTTFDAAYATSAIVVTVRRSGSGRPGCLVVT